MMTFGKLKETIERYAEVEVKFDDSGLVFEANNIKYHIGYENQLLMLTNNKDKAKMGFDSVSSLMRALQRVFES